MIPGDSRVNFNQNSRIMDNSYQKSKFKIAESLRDEDIMNHQDKKNKGLTIAASPFRIRIMLLNISFTPKRRTACR